MIGNLEILPLDQTGLYKSENLHFMNLVITSKKKCTCEAQSLSQCFTTTPNWR